jgi:hypothetical protein
MNKLEYGGWTNYSMVKNFQMYSNSAIYSLPVCQYLI